MTCKFIGQYLLTSINNHSSGNVRSCEGSSSEGELLTPTASQSGAVVSKLVVILHSRSETGGNRSNCTMTLNLKLIVLAL